MISLANVALFALLGCAQESTSEEAFPGFQLEPYLTDLTETEARICWRLEAPRPALIRFGLTLECSDGALELPSAQQHDARLTGLLPNKRYHYRVGDAFQSSFRTDPTSGPLTFAVIGHTHGTEKFASYPDTLLVAKLQELRPHFVLHCGDTTWFNTIDGFRKHFFELFAPLTQHRPVYVSPSNHDAGWPFPSGKNLEPFKSVFRYPYPTAIQNDSQEAHYAIRKHGVQFLFLSYVSPMGPGSATRSWLRQRMASGDQRFNLVVMGGSNPYYDEESFFEFLAQLPVDALLMGDSRAPRVPWKRVGDLRVFATGTGGDQPHPILWVEATDEYLAFRQLDSSGKATISDWIYPRRVEPALRKLEISKPVIQGRKAYYDFRFAEPLSSAEVSGLQMRVHCSSEKTGALYAFLLLDDWQGEVGFRTQYARLQAGDELVTLPLTQLDPSTGEPFPIRGLRILADMANPREFELQEAWLF